MKILPEYFDHLTLLQRTLFGIRYQLSSTIWHKALKKIPSVASDLLIQSTGTFLPTFNPDLIVTGADVAGHMASEPRCCFLPSSLHMLVSARLCAAIALVQGF